MSVASSKAKKLARSLRALNEDFDMSWREIAHVVYEDKVHFATLNRIAKSKGTWLPKDENVLKVLGLIRERSPYSILPRWYKRTPEALAYFKRMREAIKTESQKTRKSFDEAKKGNYILDAQR